MVNIKWIREYIKKNKEMEQSTQNKKSLYEMLLNSIDKLNNIDASIMSNKAALTSFITFLSQNEVEISKFEEASDEVCRDLEKYDFSTGFDFGSFQHKIETLHPLRLKLVKMGEESKKLSVFPDRYNSKKAIETCKKLVVACSKKMTFGEIDKVTTLVEANTQKLVDLQNLFERDGDILSRINALISTNANVLKPLKAYYAEIVQYVSDFPHNGKDDLAEIINRINTAKRIVNFQSEVQCAATRIQNYYDRYNKGAVIARYADTIHQISTSMRYSDVGIIEAQLKDVNNQIRKVADTFAREQKELKALQSSLRNHIVGIWKDDNERILNSVNALLKNDICEIPFNIEKFRSDVISAKQRRETKITTARNQYPWLNTSEYYRLEHEKLIRRNISENDYKKTINEWIIERHKWLLFLFIIPYVVWKLFLYQKFE